MSSSGCEDDDAGAAAAAAARTRARAPVRAGRLLQLRVVGDGGGLLAFFARRIPLPAALFPIAVAIRPPVCVCLYVCMYV